MRIRYFPSAVGVSVIFGILFTNVSAGVARAQISLTSTSNQYTQNFNTLSPGPTSSASFTDNETIVGLYALIGKGPIGTGAVTETPTVYQVQDGTIPVGGIASFGNSGSTDRAFGSIVTDGITATSAGFIAYGFRFVNSDVAQNITQITLSYRGEVWRRYPSVSQTLAFSYAVFDSAAGGLDMPTGYSSYSSLDFTPPVSINPAQGGLAFAQTRTDTINVTVRPGQEFWGRWVDINNPGEPDHNIGTDDLTVTAGFAPLDPTPAPPGFVTALIGSGVGGANFVFVRWRRKRRLRKKQDTGREE